MLRGRGEGQKHIQSILTVLFERENLQFFSCVFINWKSMSKIDNCGSLGND